ncbi:hypothetical protein DPSP01_003554 [Paraphaeosphaeria sporulosa]|uniref:Rhodopsin domain-containing protein n=1 Tax=Paraphaeosphaeria sporulosa TaxID=1460663 RepID=A0A177BWB2_9PLEO|nr:uncharacterized protein CC84DRAFT_1223087 [Paraphaeosphaeria sporulosa]OAF99415.1 hypothetical protein CC84DRAFT_1223087 [Paraphaeosphaeria sporulosa]
MPAVGSLTPEQVAEAEERIRNAGRIPMISLELSLGILFGLAIVTCMGRIIIRLSSRGRLALDDGLLIFALSCLAFSTGIMYKISPNYYLVQALIRGDPAAKIIASTQGYRKLTAHYNWTFANIVLSWTAIFFVKGSYFALFYPMMSVMSRHVLWFYWAAVALSAASWFVLAFGSNFILCKELGTAAVKCYFNNSRHGMFTMLAVTATLDGLTNLTIVIIPIFILRKSAVRGTVRLGVGIFLMLSVFMLICSVIRAAGVYYQGIIDCRWQSYWCHVEACIAVIMGSLTVYRSTLVGSNEVPNKMQSYLYKWFGITSDQSQDDMSVLMQNAANKGMQPEQDISNEETLVGTYNDERKSIASVKHV